MQEMPMATNPMIRAAASAALLLLATRAPVLADDGAAPAQLGPAPPAATSAWRIDLEYQHATIFDNTVQRPNNGQGTRFNFADFSGTDVNTGRVSVFAPLDPWRDGDELRFVYAPLRQWGTAPAGGPLRFDGATFQRGPALKGFYQFDTYRLTYDLPIFSNLRASGWELRVGGTVALRDARVRLSEPGLARTYANQGPIPALLYGSVTKQLAPGWRVLGEFDAFPAPGGGGLFDGSLKLAYDVTRNVAVTAGYRYEIGGATENSIDTLLGAGGAVAGVTVRF